MKLKRKTTITIRKSATQIANFAVIGDSHIGYGNSLNIFRGLLPKAVASGNKKFVIFGGDNKHGSVGAAADADYKAFKNTVTRNLGSKKIPYKASIGNWEDNTRVLFTKYLGPVQGQMNFPETKGKVKYVWLDNAPGKFSTASISLLKSLSPNYYYIIDFHWPLKVKGITVDPTHVLSSQETANFFKAIPANVRNNVVGIFTHHAHTFYENLNNIYPGFTRTKFYVCGCSGAYKCKCTSSGCGRGYYDATLTINNNQVNLAVKTVKA
ncbi:metallophosphoesterase family protein [Paenibacillus sp. IHBB 10380]|uniref:metallophosphoesterase family protein n=1 Tax=Paenibacillus sp. IHBB 10380 TaxID=1566358 RepID=UPI0005CFBC22|nr:metallophosphoesterase [Paenibacillus sp. IHBB 10380]